MGRGGPGGFHLNTVVRGSALALALALLATATALPGLVRAPVPDAQARADALASSFAALPAGRAGVLAVTALAMGDSASSADASPSLAAALLRLYEANGVAVDADEVRAQADALDADLAAALLPLVDALRASSVASRAILPAGDVALLAENPALTSLLTTFVGSAPGPVDPAWESLYAERAAALARVDRDAIAAAALPLARAVAAMPDLAAATADCAPQLDLPFVFVGGACDDTYTATYWLQVDVGGDDVYLNGVGGGVALPALGLDLGAGADTYRAQQQAQGFGLATVGLLYDEGGSDLYNVTTFGQGASTAGLGLLYDAGEGDDVYESPRGPVVANLDASGGAISTKAAGLAGVGILVDEGGNDLYQQDGLDGFVYGASNGQGWLLDRGAGNDRYTSDDTSITLLGEHLGWFTGPVEVSAEVGGTAILYEEGGNDLYRCGDHVRQGCQAAGGAGAAAFLLDQGGDDAYLMGVAFGGELGGVPVFSIGQGGAYGPSAPGGFALLRDLSGNDHYQAEKWAQGYGTVGVGVLLDLGGADVYTAGPATVGARVDGGAWADGAAGAGLDAA